MFFFSLNKEKLSPSFSLNTLCRCLTVGDSTPCAGLTTCLSTDSKTYTLLTSVHNDTDDADDYNRVFGIAQLKVFSYAKKQNKGYPSTTY